MIGGISNIGFVWVIVIAWLAFPLWWVWTKPSECFDKHGEISSSRYRLGLILVAIGISLFLFMPTRTLGWIGIIAAYIFIGLGCKIQNRKYKTGSVDWLLWLLWAGFPFICSLTQLGIVLEH